MKISPRIGGLFEEHLKTDWLTLSVGPSRVQTVTIKNNLEVSQTLSHPVHYYVSKTPHMFFL